MSLPNYTGTRRLLEINGTTVEAKRAQFYCRTYHMGGDYYTNKSGWDFFVDGIFVDGGTTSLSPMGTSQPIYKTIKEFVDTWTDRMNKTDWDRMMQGVEEKKAKAAADAPKVEQKAPTPSP
jgi:hypothetical protein